MTDTLQDTLEHVNENRVAQIWTALPGIVRSYDAAAQTASVQPAVQDFQESEDGERTDRSCPLVTDVPVCWTGGSGQYWHPGLAAGDEVLLVFSTLDPSGWHRSGSVSKAADLRRHHISHAFAIPGATSRGRALPATPGAKIQRLEVGGTADAVVLAATLRAELTLIKAALDTIAAAVPVSHSYVVPSLASLQSALLKVNS
jgi:hypothetical protein